MIAGQQLTASPVALRPHPRFRQSAVERIMVEGARTPDHALHIRYVVTGALDRIHLAVPASSLRRDSLWRTTCFEAFMLADDTPGYYEANFSPSSEWAAYHFDAYRMNMKPAPVGAPPRIVTAREGDRLTLDVRLDPSWVPPTVTLRFGLSAVIEADDGTLSYWALAHPPGNPDFHHRDCFALELAATDPL
jgi:hypothetical protein